MVDESENSGELDIYHRDFGLMRAVLNGRETVPLHLKIWFYSEILVLQ